MAAKTRTATTAGTIALTVLVLLFGNQAVAEWITRHSKPDTAIGWYMRKLSWPAWLLGPRDGTNAAMRDMLGQDMRALLVVLLFAVVLSMMAKSFGGAIGLMATWSATIFGAALAAFITAFIMSDPTIVHAFDAASGAASYGLFVGWIVGLAAVLGKKG